VLTGLASDLLPTAFRPPIAITLFAATTLDRVYRSTDFYPDDGVELVPPGHGPSFRCASGDLHWTFTVEPGVHVPVTDVLGVRWMIQ